MSKCLKFFYQTSLFFYSFFLVNSWAWALTRPPFPQYVTPGTGGAPITSPTDILWTLVDIVDFMQAVFWIAAAGFGLLSAYLYLASVGDTEKLKRAKNMLIYTVVAVALAVIAYGIPIIVSNFIGRR